MLITNVDDKTQITQPTDLKQPDAVYDKAQSKQAQNTAIVRAQLEVTLEMGNEPMALLYKTALEAINEVLDPTLESKPIQNSYESNVDVSPEATAKRIVSFATGFYHTFQQQNPDITSDESLNNFMTVIGGGIEKGFKDAREILESLSVLNGKIAEDIDSTYDLVQEGLKKFVDNFNTVNTVNTVNTAETSEG